MKKHWKTLIFATATAAVLSCGMNALAVSDVHATLFTSPVFVEGRRVYCRNPQDKRVEYLSYNGTTYIPIRTAGEWMGKNVAWDEDSKTITLSGISEKIYHDTIVDRAVDDDTFLKMSDNGVTVRLRDDIKVVVDGKEQTFQNAKGETVYPINFNNMNYLPVRNIGELSGMTVKYMPQSSPQLHEAIYLRTALTDSQIADGTAYVETLKNSTSYQALLAQNKAPKALQKVYGLDGSTEDNIFNLMHREYPDLNDLKEMATLASQTMQLWIDTPKPDCPVLDYYYDVMQTRAKEAKDACDAVLQAIADGKDVETCRTLMIQDSFKTGHTSAASMCAEAEVALNYMEDVLLENY